jgi:hypothetical protein
MAAADIMKFLLTLLLYHVPVTFETCADDIDKWPLRIALEEVSPYPQHCRT